MKLNKTFETNGKVYKTNSETLELLSKLHNEGKNSAAKMIFNCGLVSGSIQEIN